MTINKKLYLSGLMIAILSSGCTTGTNSNSNLNNKASISHSDFLTENALHDAVRTNDLELVKFLVKKGANIDQQDRYGYTPLHLAVRYHNYDIASYLISQHAKVNTIDNYSDTPLLDSTRNDDTNISKLLICNGAKRDVVDSHGMSTLNNSSKNNNIYISKLLTSDNLSELCGWETDKNTTKVVVKPEYNLPPDINISIEEHEVYNDNMPTICGDVDTKEKVIVDVGLENEFDQSFGRYNAKVDKNNHWCANVTDELPNGNYTIDATAYTRDGESATAKSQTEIYVIEGLYEALIAEFGKDLEKWNAQIDKDSLTFRFKDPSMLFAKGGKNLSDKYKKILDDFFPRYIKVLLAYQLEINSVIIEGHSSSEHKLGKTLEEKYKMNLKLSQERANQVLKYVEKNKDKLVQDNMIWIDTTFMAKGLSSSKPIYNEDGTENKKASRRVEFRIETAPKNI